MPHRDAPAICRKIDAALDYMGDDEEQFRPYLIYQIKQILGGSDHITLDDCAASELMSFLALLAPIFSRRLAGVSLSSPPEPVGGKLLTLILGDGGVDDASTGT
jgi:hypothetical protein